MANPFDQFDPPKKAANPFDQFDVAAPPPPPPPAGTAQAAPAPTSPQPEGGGFTGAVTGLVNQFLGGTQRSSPVLEQRQPLGELGTFDFGQGFEDAQGHYTPIDPTKHDVFLDPSGKPMVYAKTPETTEGLAPSMGRVLGGGAVAGPVAGVQSAAKAAPAVGLLRDFDRLRVDPSLAAVTQSRTAGIVQNTVKEVPFAGNKLAADAGKQVAKVGEAANRLSAEVGRAGDETGRLAGGGVQRGLEIFKEEIVPTKGKQLYDKFWSHFGKRDYIDLPNTARALSGPASRFDNPEMGDALADPLMQKYAEIIKRNGGVLSINDARNFRTEIGKRPDIDQGYVKRIYEAMTRDLEEGLGAGAPEALRDMKRADWYWRASRKRLKDTANLLGEKVSEEGVYQSLIRMAQTKGSQADFNKLAQVRRSMPGDEWEDFTATLIANMGRPKPGQADPISKIGFSPSTFVTEWEKLSDQAKAILFNSTGRAEWAKDMNALVRVSGSLKNVEKLANTSGTARVGGLMAATAGMMAEPVTTVLTLASAVGAEKLIMSPQFVRMLTAAGRGGRMDVRAFANQLRNLAVNPEVGPSAYRLAAALEDRDTSRPARTGP